MDKASLSVMQVPCERPGDGERADAEHGRPVPAAAAGARRRDGRGRGWRRRQAEQAGMAHRARERQGDRVRCLRERTRGIRTEMQPDEHMYVCM